VITVPILSTNLLGLIANHNVNPIKNAKKIEGSFDVGDHADKYDRALMYVYVDGKLLQDILIEEGLARVGYAYEPNTSLLSTAENPSSVKRVPFAIGEERLFTKPGLIALAETCKEIGYSLGVGEALGVIVQQLTELHPELTEELATEIAKDFTFKIEVKDARSEGILVPDNPEGIFSKVSVALGLRISAKTL